jgi:hypothetical protein
MLQPLYTLRKDHFDTHLLAGREAQRNNLVSPLDQTPVTHSIVNLFNLLQAGILSSWIAMVALLMIVPLYHKCSQSWMLWYMVLRHRERQRK